jgi:hypothetical protein
MVYLTAVKQLAAVIFYYFQGMASLSSLSYD